MSRVLGVDPGLARTGVAVVQGTPGALRLEHVELIETVPQTSGPARLAALHALMSGLCAELRPDVAAVEELFFSTNRRTAMRVGEARGVVISAIAGAGVAVFEYTPTQVKEAVCGYGAARKPQVSRMVAGLLNIDELSGPDDVTDACAIAVCHHHRARLQALTGGQSPARRSASLDLAIARARASARPAR